MRARAWAWWLGLLGAVAGARELDPAACAARFDVQRDKIIRTEESRDMGARYLSELDVGARAECLRLCCETDLCDVFVYEEKGPGSCYLFACGPPEDFRCKFTTHSNFSSGVLALSRRLAELQDQEQRAHRERELASLRSATSRSTSTSTAPPPPPAPAATPHYPPPGRCSRYQFACRRGGECIAVYNACDGVAQCADGSDEAPELGCPTPPPPPPPPPRPSAPAPPTRPPPHPLPEASSDDGGGGGGSAAAAGARWPHRLAQAQPPRLYPPESAVSGVGAGGGGPHIFSHKGGLVAAGAPFEPAAAWGRRWGHAAPSPAPWPRAWPLPLPPRLDPGQEVPESEYGGAGEQTMPEVGEYSGGQHTLRDSAKKGPAPPPDLREEPPRPPHHLPEHKPTPELKPEWERRAVGAVGAEHEGRSERPAAAVLLLVLGVALTGALAALAGCRARAARRRRARGKHAAHDADYLVNGMYL